MSPPPPPPPPPSSPPPPTFSLSLKSIGLGYALAIALGFLVLLSALLLSSYVCCRTRRRNRRRLPTTTAASPSSSGVIVPRIIFVAEEDETDDQNRGGSGSGSSPIGLDRAVINSYPKFQFYKNNLEHSTEDTNNSMCSICLCDYKEGEMLRMMPDCKHCFHLCCLDAWLKLNGSCPVCRNSPLPTPISTPLAEVVPLSQYPDNRRRSTVVSSS